MKTLLSAVVTLALTLGAVEARSDKAPREQQVSLRIESKTLAEALDQWAQQTGFQIFLANWEMAKKTSAPQLRGKYSAREALDRLLEGTPWMGVWTTDRQVTIREKTVPIALQAVPGAPTVQKFVGDGVDSHEPARTGNSAAPRADSAPIRDKSALEEVIVTGTNIPGGSIVSPVVRIDRRAIERSGASTTQQVLERVSQNFGGGIGETTVSSFVPGVDEANNVGFGAGVNLRGLGSDATLVLINGHRLSPTGAGNFVDVSQIPVGAIDRIEVVTDGASAIYGSDAVAGVVNVLLRDDFEGAETRLRYGSMADGGPPEYGLQQTFGHSWSEGNALLTYDFFDRDSLSIADRPFAQPPIGDLSAGQRRHSALASITQQLSSIATLAVDGLYSTRDSSFLGPDTFASLQADLIHHSQSDSLAGNAAVRVALARDWALNVSGLYSRSKVDWRRTPLERQASSIEIFDNDLWSAQVHADGPLFSVAGGPVKLVLGGAYRRETYSDTVNHAAPRVKAARDVNSAFGELLIPIVGDANSVVGIERLDLSLAARYEDYSDVGSSTDPKIGVLWKMNPGVTVRGTYGTSFRAPNFNQTSSFLDEVFLVDFPDSNPAGSSLALFLAGADPQIEPEESRQWTIGLDVSPAAISGLTVNATYFELEFEGRVDTPSSAIFDLLTAGDVFAPVVTRIPSSAQIAAALAYSSRFTDLTEGRSPDETEVIIDNRTQNIGRTDVRGLDLSVAYAFQTNDSSAWRAFIGGTRLFAFENRLTPAAASDNILDTLFNPLATRLRGGMEWSRGSWSADVSCSYANDYVNDAVSPRERIASWTTVDASVGYQDLGPASAAFLEGLSVRLSAVNLLNKYPPAVSSPTTIVLPTGYDPTNANPLGRMLFLQLTKNW